MDGPLRRARRLISWFVRPFTGKEPSFYRAVTACLFAATLFWQMNALNKTYTTRLNYPLAWHYDSLHYVPLRPLPTALPVTVTGPGWQLLRANLGWGTQPASLRPVPLPGTRYLPAAVWRRGLQAALEGLQINDWTGDTLRLTFDRCASRRLSLALAPVPAGSFTPHFAPSTVTFRGPASVVNALPDPYLIAAPPAAADSSADPGEGVELRVPAPARVRLSVATVQLRWLPRHASPSIQ